MKYLLSFLFTAIVLFVATYFLLGIWGIEILTPGEFRKTMWTVGIVVATAALLTIVIIAPFIKRYQDRVRYDQNADGVAQRKL